MTRPQVTDTPLSFRRRHRIFPVLVVPPIALAFAFAIAG